MISRQIRSSRSSLELLRQLLVALRRPLRQFLARGRRAQQRVSALDDDRALLGDQLVVTPGVGVHVEQLALGDALGVIEQPGRLVADDAAVLVGLGRQLVALLRLQVRDDDVVLPAGEEHRRAGVALAASAAAQLVVQPLGVVAAGADDVQAAELGDLVVVGLVGAAQPDVGAAARHLGGHRDRAQLARLGDDRGLLGVVLGVQHDGGHARP